MNSLQYTLKLAFPANARPCFSKRSSFQKRWRPLQGINKLSNYYFLRMPTPDSLRGPLSSGGGALYRELEYSRTSNLRACALAQEIHCSLFSNRVVCRRLRQCGVVLCRPIIGARLPTLVEHATSAFTM